MKRIFTLFFCLCMLARHASAEVEYKSLGMGYMTDDMITQLLDLQPVTYQVEILQAADDSPLYRVMAPYGKTFAQAMEDVNNKVLTPAQYDSEGKCFIDIDATDPQDVIFHKTMTGFDIGAGEMFIGINNLYNVTLEDGVFRAPLMGIAVGSGNSAVAANRRGKFRIVLPGYVLNDYTLKITPKSQCLTERKFEASIEVGQDVAEVKYAVAQDWQEDEIMGAVKQIVENGATFNPRGDFYYEMDEYCYKETIVAVGLDANGQTVGYDWCTYYFIDENPDGWSDCGEAEFTDGVLQDLIKNIPSQTTKCMMQQSKDNPGRYRLVDPYSGLEEYAALNKGHEGHHHYIYINADDPDYIYLEESPIGLESAQYGLMRITSMTHYFLMAGYDIEDCMVLVEGAVVEDGVMTFPKDLVQFSMLKFDNGDWLTANSAGLTSLKLPEGFSFTASISDIVAEENAVPEYYNLQGVRIQNPQAGSLYIKRVNGKATKIIAQ